MNIVFIQHGNYAAAHERFEKGQPETYRDQLRSVRFVESLSKSANVTVASFSKDSHDVEISPSLRSIGLKTRNLDKPTLQNLLPVGQIDLLICRTPHVGVLRYAKKHNIRTLPNFADIFESRSLKERISNLRLRLLLNGPHISCISNHSLNASASLVSAVNVPKKRVVPWDWSRLEVVEEPKKGFRDARVPTVFFAGALSAKKGVGDCIEAARFLHKEGTPVNFTFAGPGDVEKWRAVANEARLENNVQFVGLIPQSEVRAQMNRHDIIVVPTQHSYAEGLPNTIYEGLASHTPLVLSDHPAFRGRLKPEEECLEFSASNPQSLAQQILRLVSDPGLYEKLSVNAPAALDNLYVGMDWCDLISQFIEDPANSTGWVDQNSLERLQSRPVLDNIV